jgi:hypothetical protein
MRCPGTSHSLTQERYVNGSFVNREGIGGGFSDFLPGTWDDGHQSVRIKWEILPSAAFGNNISDLMLESTNRRSDECSRSTRAHLRLLRTASVSSCLGGGIRPRPTGQERGSPEWNRQRFQDCLVKTNLRPWGFVRFGGSNRRNRHHHGRITNRTGPGRRPLRSTTR